MKLYIDVGNTRIKWLTVSAHGVRSAVSAVRHDELDELARAWADLPVQAVYGCNVAGAEIAAALQERVPTDAIQWIVPSATAAGVVNAYRQSTLGADRWAAVVGARAVEPHTACIVACAGTALTVDSVRADGVFLGGTIAPGLHLMRMSLEHGAADLRHALGQWQAIPQTSADAIYSGCLNALVWAIEGAYQRLCAQTLGDVQIILSGGDAQLIAPLLPRAVRIVDNLVLIGLVRITESC